MFKKCNWSSVYVHYLVEDGAKVLFWPLIGWLQLNHKINLHTLALAVQSQSLIYNNKLDKCTLLVML